MVAVVVMLGIFICAC